jgi:hypothetical protein
VVDGRSLGCNLQVFLVENRSGISVPFTVPSGELGVLSVDPVMGVLQPYAAVSFTAIFAPSLEGNYWKRLSIILANTEPLDLDLYGTGFSPTARPPPLALSHIDSFTKRIAEGGPVLPLVQSDDVLLSDVGLSQARIGGENMSPFGYHSWDLIFKGQDVTHGIRLDTLRLFFPPTSVSEACESQIVYATNCLPFIVTIAAHVPKWKDIVANGQAARVWDVTPASVDAQPGERVRLTITFQPTANGKHYTQLIDIVARAKYMRNFRLCCEVCV